MSIVNKTQGIHRASVGEVSRADTLPDTLPQNGASHRENDTDRVSQGICFLQKDGQVAVRQEQDAQGVLPPFIESRYPGYPVDPPPSGRAAYRLNTKKAQRRLKRRSHRISKWWASVPLPRPFFFTPAQLVHAIGLDLPRIAPALRMLGWTRCRRTLNHRSGTYWLPPGSPITHWPRHTFRHFACL